MKKAITVIVNGESWNIDVAPNEILLDVLRNKIGVKSPKIGCERGDCGACTIFLDGKTVRSCLILAVESDGCKITTIEGLSEKGHTPLQQAFAENNSFQCGFCAPGTILSATELLEKNPHPSKEEVQEAISGNLCRCTGYKSVIETVLKVSRSNEE